MNADHSTNRTHLVETLEAFGRAVPVALLLGGIVTGALGTIPLAALAITAGMTLLVYPHLEPGDLPDAYETAAFEEVQETSDATEGMPCSNLLARFVCPGTS